VERDSLYQTVRTFEGYEPQPDTVRPQGPAPQGSLFQIAHRKRKMATAAVDGAE
jgi:hypothetical protein